MRMTDRSRPRLFDGRARPKRKRVRPKAGIDRPARPDLLSWPAQDPNVRCCTAPWRVFARAIAATIALLGSRVSCATPFIISIYVESRP